MTSLFRPLYCKNLFFRSSFNLYNLNFSTKSGASKKIISRKYKLSILAIGAGIGILWARNYQVNLTNLFPQLQAAQIFNRGDSDENLPKGYNNRNFNFIADVVEKVSPAVVYIEVFNTFGFAQIAMSNGSGFIVEPNGLILTNAHVVGNAKEVKIQLKDGQIFTGYVETIDKYSDLATVRIKASGLPVLPLGKSSQVRPGEWVVALGSPLTLSNTITAGVVSSIRPSSDLGFPSKDMDFIQTDAAITFGNSGGPLVNLDGEAIGINSMKVTAGISFAIPSDYAAKFLEMCKKKSSKRWFGKPSKYIGITMLTLTPSFIKTMMERNSDFPHVKEGVYIWRLIKDSPAHLAGLLPGDIITHINKKPIQNALQVTEAVESNSQIEVTVQRQNEILSFIIIPQLHKE